jgi:hypothetical protein
VRVDEGLDEDAVGGAKGHLQGEEGLRLRQIVSVAVEQHPVRGQQAGIDLEVHFVPPVMFLP